MIFSFLIKKSKLNSIEIEIAFLFHSLGNLKGRKLDYWSVGPIRPSDQSDVIVAGFLHMFLSGLSGYISVSS